MRHLSKQDVSPCDLLGESGECVAFILRVVRALCAKLHHPLFAVSHWRPVSPCLFLIHIAFGHMPLAQRSGGPENVLNCGFGWASLRKEGGSEATGLSGPGTTRGTHSHLVSYHFTLLSFTKYGHMSHMFSRGFCEQSCRVWTRSAFLIFRRYQLCRHGRSSN